MTAYRERIRGRMRWMIAGCVLAAAVGAFGAWYAFGNMGVNPATDFIRGMQTGLLAVVVGALCITSIGYGRALRDEARLRRLYTEENDERNRFIRDRIGGIGMDLSLFLLAVATVVAGFFDATVSITLAAALAALAFVKAGLKFYFRAKF